MVRTQPTIVVDIDGVLFQTPLDAVAASNKKHGTTYAVQDIFDHNAKHNKDLFVVAGVDQFYDHQLDMKAYTPVPGCVETLRELAKSAKIIALTSRSYDMFYEVTMEAIKTYFDGIIDEVYFTRRPGSDDKREKGDMIKEMGGSLLIDDSVGYCESCLKVDIPAILFGQPYNAAGHEYPAELRAIDWPHVAVIAKRILN